MSEKTWRTRALAGGAGLVITAFALAACSAPGGSGESTGDAHQHFMCCNGLLHAEIVRLAGNPLLERVMAPLADRTDRLNGVSQHHDRESRHEEHVLLVEAITTGNAELAGSCAVVHIERERRRAMAALPSHPHFAGR